jgi:hypothetical protein
MIETDWELVSTYHQMNEEELDMSRERYAESSGES